MTNTKDYIDIFSANDVLTALGRKQRANLTLDELLERHYRPDVTTEDEGFINVFPVEWKTSFNN